MLFNQVCGPAACYFPEPHLEIDAQQLPEPPQWLFDLHAFYAEKAK